MATEREVSISTVCRHLGYSKQSYYKSLHRHNFNNYQYKVAKQKVLTIRQQMPRIGTRKLYHLLREEFKREGISVGRDKLFTLLRQEHLLVGKRKRFTKTTNSHHWMRKHPDMVKDMTIERPEQLWVADITYVAIETGYAYLHLVTDAYSKQIMGYFISADLSASSTIKALTMALENRKYNNKLIHHSDRGLQYCSSGYVKILNENNVSISMTQSGSPYDNAIAERVSRPEKNSMIKKNCYFF